MGRKVLATIVTFNADIVKLHANIESILSQNILGASADILVVDNGSENIVELGELVNELGVSLEKLGRNTGIANALQKALNYAKSHFFDFLLTMDQDSMFLNFYAVECQMESMKQNDKAAIIGVNYLMDGIDTERIEAARIADRESIELQEFDHVITSGSLCRIEALDKIGGFNIELFIDAVDIELCYRLRRAGYGIFLCKNAFMLHNVGEYSRKRLLKYTLSSYNHSAFRLYYIARNYTYLVKEFTDIPQARNCFNYFVHRKFIILLYENHKLAKLKALRKGFNDGKAFTTKFAVNEK